MHNDSLTLQKKYLPVDVLKTASKIAGAFFLFIMLLSITKNTVLYAIYEYDIRLFVTMFCENKNRTELKCNGKCKLAKMQHEQDEENAASRLKQLQTEIVYFFPVKPIPWAGNHPPQQRKIIFLYYEHPYSFELISRLVKPPETFPG